jgi:hypothetical protein
MLEDRFVPSASFTSFASTTFIIGEPGSFTVSATGSPTPTLAEDSKDTLPAGIAFNAATGVLSGTPAEGTDGTYTLHFSADNGTTVEATQTFSLGVLLPKSLNITSAAPFPVFNLANPNPSSGGAFGGQILTLSTGNIVVTDSAVNNNAGAVYLFNGRSGALISTLIGSTAGDNVGGGSITALDNGNFVVASPSWNNSEGAVTWGSGTTGFSATAGATVTISASNSLVGSSPRGNGSAGDLVGSGGVIALKGNGNYVVDSPDWGGDIGAVTWGSGTAGVSGTISASNSGIGSSTNDHVGSGGIFALTNGNYVVDSPQWNDSVFGHALAGAVTWGSGAMGFQGTLSTNNSLVGNHTNDEVGSGFAGHSGITPLTNGNFMVLSPNWNNDDGAATWMNGSTGGTSDFGAFVDASNSLQGTSSFDSVGSGGAVALTNGNCVVISPVWSGDNGSNQELGATTWINGANGSTSDGVMTINPPGTRSFNSLMGGVGDEAGSGGVVALSNGNYVVLTPTWVQGTGAATFVQGINGSTEDGFVHIEPSNSLLGTNQGDRVSSGGVTALTNGNYIVASPAWNSNAGAATWVSGINGGTADGQFNIDVTNSLEGFLPGDAVGSQGITALANGNYVVDSPAWNGGMGAATWGNGNNGTTVDGQPAVSSTNSLVGTISSDAVGGSGILALTNGNYVVLSSSWNQGAGAATWGNGTIGTTGTVSIGNSLIGSNPGDGVGQGAFPLFDGDYVVTSPTTATWESGTNLGSLDGLDTRDPQNTIFGTATQTPGVGSAHAGPLPRSFVVALSGNGGQAAVAFTDPNDLNFAAAQGQTLALSPLLLSNFLAQGSNLILQANDDIAVDSFLSGAGSAGNITLQAGRSIFLNAPIGTAGSNLSLIANDTAADGVVDKLRDPGNAVIAMASGTKIDTAGGNLSIDLKKTTDKTNNGSGSATLLGLTTNAATLSSTTTVGITINGTNPGDGVTAGTFTQVNVTGPINLNGAPLSIINTAATAAGNTFTIVQATGGVTGTFAGLSEGATVTGSDGSKFTISYQGNGGKDVTLTETAGPAPVQISGKVFQDVNINGAQDASEPGIAGQTVFIDLNGSGVLQAGDPTATTDANGNYQLTVNPYGTYTVVEVLLGGVLLDSPPAGALKVAVGGSGATAQNFADVPTSITVPLTLPLTSPFPKQGNANADFVEAVYRAVLDRNADAFGLSNWLALLNNGTISRLQFVQRVRQSQEHFQQEVTDFYTTILSRQPDANGLAQWVNVLQNGQMTEEQVAAAFLDSPEYLSKGDRYFVDHMYLSILGRNFDSAGEANWLNALGDDASGNPTHPATMTHPQVISGFLNSLESLNRLVEGYYQIFLRRLADPFGLGNWLALLQQGGSFLSIGQGFLASQEFYDDAAAQG